MNEILLLGGAARLRRRGARALARPRGRDRARAGRGQARSRARSPSRGRAGGRRRVKAAAPSAGRYPGGVDVRSFTVGPVAENCFVAAARRLRPRACRRSRRGGRPDPAAVEEMGVTVDAILAHPHPLRPHRRRGAGRQGHRRTGVLPRDRGARAGGHHVVRPLARVRTVRELRGRRDGRWRRAASSSPGSRSTSCSRRATVPAT